MWEQVQAIGVLHRAGMINLYRPDQVLASIRAVRAYGPIAGPALIAARRDADAVAVIDELGELSYEQLDRRSNALARAWARQGFGADSVIAVLCRDHRWVIDTMLACAKLGARLLLMNTGFGATQLADVAAREGVTALVHDAEFADLVPAALTSFLADERGAPDHRHRRRRAANAAQGGQPGAAHQRHHRHPEGRAEADPLTAGCGAVPGPDSVAARGAHVPGRADLPRHRVVAAHPDLRARLDRCAVPRFDARATLAGIAAHRCTALVVVPTMLRRIMDLPDAVRAEYDTSSLRVLFSAGSALGADLGNRATAAFGPVIHNLYGSTEVAVATIATPQDWRAAPGTVGNRRAAAGSGSTTRRATGHRGRAGRGGSSRAVRSPSAGIRAAAPRRSSTGCSPPATSATSTRTGCCSWTGATTT